MWKTWKKTYENTVRWMSWSAHVQLWNILLLVRGSAGTGRWQLSLAAHLGGRCTGLSVLLYWHCQLHRLTLRLILEHLGNTTANTKLFPQVSKYSPYLLFTIEHVLNPEELLLLSSKDEVCSSEGLFRGCQTSESWLEDWVISRGPLQPELFCDSMIHKPLHFFELTVR